MDLRELSKFQEYYLHTDQYGVIVLQTQRFVYNNKNMKKLESYMSYYGIKYGTNPGELDLSDRGVILIPESICNSIVGNLFISTIDPKYKCIVDPKYKCILDVAVDFDVIFFFSTKTRHR
mgnify:CR=1 FL=1